MDSNNLTSEFASVDWWKTTIDPKILETELANNKIKEAALQKDKHERRIQLLHAIGPIIELKSNYWGVSSYYFNPTRNQIYEINNANIMLLHPSADVDQHLRELNNLPR